MKKRLIALYVCFFLLLGVLLVRLTFIQLIDNEKFASIMARQQRITLDGADNRGTIYDRNMNPITGADDEYIYIIEKGKITTNTVKVLETIGAKRVTNDSKRYYVYRSKIFNEDAAYILKRDYNAFIIKDARRYSEEQPAVHFIGYVNKTDGNGACGIEKDFNDILSRKNKTVYASADGKRMIIPGLGIYSTVNDPNCCVVTTLDINIQKKAEEILNASGYYGSLIVIDATSGEVLASASSPSFCPYDIEEYLDSSNREFVNKATQSQYPPGSIFKLIVAAAALENGIVTPDTTFDCKGYEEINGIRIKCASGDEGHGTITFREAFAKSCNATFIQVGILTGGAEILEMAKKFGIGEKTISNLSEEKLGLLPDIPEIQGAGIGNLSIGQGKLLVTPMQAARVTSIIASNGIDRGLSLIKATTSNGEVNNMNKNIPVRVISRETANTIKNFMVDTVSFGTANNLSSDLGVKIAGKTGSAQSSYNGEEVVHGWFTGFMPADDPKYVITVFIESGGSGRGSAVPLFQEMAAFLD